MKKILILFILTLTLFLTSCGNDENTIKVGASSTPHAEILEFVRPLLKEKGYKLEIIEIDDYTIPNTSLAQGSIDANYFQHLPFLNLYNQNNNTNLVSVAAIHYEPFGLYGNQITNLSEATKQILIPNDGSNRSRALLLLQQVGLITLKEGLNPENDITLDDVINFNGYDIKELSAENIPSSFKYSTKGTLAVINGNYALSAGINIKDALATEDEKSVAVSTYANIIAVKEENKNDLKIQALIEVLTSDEVKNYIVNTYNGAVRPVNWSLKIKKDL